MKEQIEILIHLQKIETQAGKINFALAGVSKKIAALDSEINSYENIAEEKKSFIDDLRKKYRASESDYQTNLAFLAKSQDKLTAVKTNKEYQSVLKEIDDIKIKSSAIEEEMLKNLDAIETAEQEITKLKKEFLLIKEKINEEKEIINKEAEQNRIDITVLDEEKNNISKKVSSEVMAKYNMLKEFTKGMAIAPTIDSICQGCNMNIPPQMYNELLRFDSIKHCPHCQRIIYWGKL